MSYLPLILYVLHAFNVLAADVHEPPPTQSTHVIAVAIAVAAADADPLYKDDADRHKTVALLAVMSHQESRWTVRAAGDCGGMKPGSHDCTLAKAASVGAFQQDASAKTLIGSDREAFASDAFAQARVALSELRKSFRVCPTAPIAYYAHGRNPVEACADSRSIGISNWRMARARWLRTQTEKVAVE
jgi:hypothetical protein